MVSGNVARFRLAVIVGLSLTVGGAALVLLARRREHDNRFDIGWYHSNSRSPPTAVADRERGRHGCRLRSYQPHALLPDKPTLWPPTATSSAIKAWVATCSYARDCQIPDRIWTC